MLLRRTSPLLIVAMLIGGPSPASETDVDAFSSALTGVPSREDVAAALSVDPDYRDLSAEERERWVDLFHGRMVLETLFAGAAVQASCAAEISSLCDVNEPTPQACLRRHEEELGSCCAASLRQTSGDPRLQAPERHHGLILPVGSTLRFEEDCGRSSVTLPESVWHGDLRLGPGAAEFAADGRLLSARLAPDQRVHGYRLAGGEERIDFHESGFFVEARLAHPSTVDGLALGVGDRPVSLHSNGQLASGTVAENSVRGDMTVGPGPILLAPDGTVTFAVLGADLVLPRVRVPAGARVSFDASGRPEDIMPTTPMTVAGFTLRAGHTYRVHPTGVPQGFQIRAFTVVDDRPYPALTTIELGENGEIVSDSFRRQAALDRKWAEASGNRYAVELIEAEAFGALTVPARSWLTRDPRGRRHQALVARTYDVGGLVVGPGEVEFSDEGRIVTGQLAREQTYGDIVVGPGELRLHDDGRIRRAAIASPQRVDAVVLAGDTTIDFHASGEWARATLAAGSRLAGNTLVEAAEVAWHDTGELRSLDVEQAIAVDGIEYDGATMHFEPSGRLLDAVLNRTATIDGVTYAAGTQLRLDERGRVANSLFVGRRWPTGAPPEPIALDPTVAYVGAEMVSLRWGLNERMTVEECAAVDSGNASFGLAVDIDIKRLSGCGTDAERGIVPLASRR